MKNTDLPLFDRKKYIYLIVGGFNTLVGYVLGVALFYLMETHLHVFFIGLISNILAIAISFSSYKHFVFKTRGNWLKECLRAYFVYGLIGLCSVFILWILVDGVGLQIWISQGLAIILTTVLSYVGHSRFTFKN